MRLNKTHTAQKERCRVSSAALLFTHTTESALSAKHDLGAEYLPVILKLTVAAILCRDAAH